MTYLKADSGCCGVSLNQCHVLLEAAEQPVTKVDELTTSLAMDKSSLSKTIDGLVKLEYMDRAEDPQDRRYQLIELTGTGRKFVESIDNICNREYAEVMDKLPPEIQGRILEDLTALINAFREVKSKEGPCCKT